MPDRSQVWMRLSPDAEGKYRSGSWNFTAPMSIPRLFFASNVVRDTRLIVIGGEYSGSGLPANWTNTGEAYNPATDTWQGIAPHPEPQFGDDPTILLDGDRILAGSLGTPNTWIYHYPTDTWEETPIPKVYNDRSDEETWVKLPGGRVLNYDLFQSLSIPHGQFAEIFDPRANRWVPASPTDGTPAGFIPQLSASNLGFELGGALQEPRTERRFRRLQLRG
jgi:Kelch motif